MLSLFVVNVDEPSAQCEDFLFGGWVPLYDEGALLTAWDLLEMKLKLVEAIFKSVNQISA